MKKLFLISVISFIAVGFTAAQVQATVYTDGFEIADSYQWNATLGCAESDDVGDCQAPYAPVGAPACGNSGILGFGTGHKFRVDTSLGNGCSPTGVNYFTGGLTSIHNGTNPPPNHGTWLIANTTTGNPTQTTAEGPQYTNEIYQSHEMLISKDTQTSNTSGWIQIEFKWHNDGSKSPIGSPCDSFHGGNDSGDHAVLAANATFEAATCNSINTCESCDSTGFCTTASSCGGAAGAEKGCAQDHMFYAVIAGSFGFNGVPANSCGFVIEKARQYNDAGGWHRQVQLFPSSFFNYTLQDNTWYRMKLERTTANGGTLQYTAWRWSGSAWSQIATGSDTTFNDVNELALGKVGFYGYWIREGAHVDVDNFDGSW
jgi:hypothetical protein